MSKMLDLTERLEAAMRERGLELVKLDNRQNNLGRTPAFCLAEELAFQELNRPRTGSYPLMDIARVLDVPYGVVLLYSDWHDKHTAAMSTGMADDRADYNHFMSLAETVHEQNACRYLRGVVTEQQMRTLNVIVDLTRKRRIYGA